MTVSKHIILGAGGVISYPLVRELQSRGQTVKLVSRRGHELPGTESIRADLTKGADVLAAVETSSIVYLVAGLPYNTLVWSEVWPKVMQNTIDACSSTGARLLFFDNVYMYGKVEGAMTEESPISPCSKKGEVRAHIANLLLTAVGKGNLRGLIARSADFYGPFASASSVPMSLVIERLMMGKKARWLGNAHKKHSLTYTVDCGKALALLAESEDAYGQVWHLPTASPPITGEEFIRIAARKLEVSPAHSVLGRTSLRLAGLFSPIVREAYEMIYQNEDEYIFDSSKFEKRFRFRPTPYEEGIGSAVEYALQKRGEKTS